MTAPPAIRVEGGSSGARWWPRVRLLCGVLLLAAVIWRLGTGPFLAGVRSLDATAVLVALVIGALTTVCSAWRWRVVAGRLGVGLSLRAAVAAYYGSQFLNATLPGGVLGDVHRAVRHGRGTGDSGRGIRSVAWERSVGPVVHVALTVLVLLAVPSPVQAGAAGPLVVAGAAVVLVAVLVVRGRPAGSRARVRRLLAAAAAEARLALLDRSAWPQILIASLIVVLGHAVTFVVAARITGAPASPVELFPVAMVVLAAMVVPLNVGGWGPRESAAAGMFAAAGWGAAQGVAAATAFGLMALIATLPGMLVLAARPFVPVGAGRGRGLPPGGDRDE